MTGARSILLAAGLLAAAGGAAAAPCGAQRDALTAADPVMPAIRPADCATVLPDAAALSWPGLAGAPSYIVTLTRPDGSVDVVPTPTNTLPLREDLSPGTYTWRVTVPGTAKVVGEERRFTVETPRLVQPAG